MTAEFSKDSRPSLMSWGSLGLVATMSAVMGGAVGLMMVAMMFWLCGRSWIVDHAESHGISESQSSRLGGVAVFSGAFAFFVAAEWTRGNSFASLWPSSISGQNIPSFIWGALLIALVGLWDDFVTRFSPIVRLFLVLIISSVTLLSAPNLMPATAYEWLPYELNSSVLLMIAGTLVVTGFVNAGNMADGANGLLASIALSFFCVSMWHSPSELSSFLIMALLIFTVFNVATGRIFLGDFGSYGLSAVIAFGSLQLYASGDFSSWFFACLLAYPCFEMVRVVLSRVAQGNSPLQAGDDHLHNYAYMLLRDLGWHRLFANSVTGCSVGLVSAFVPSSLVLVGKVSIGDTSFWQGYFLAYMIVHLMIAQFLRRVTNAA